MDNAPATGAPNTTAITVNKVTPSITWATPAPITFGTALSATQLNATANVNGTFTYSPTAGEVLNAGTQTLSVTFDPDSDNYNSANLSVTIDVLNAAPTVTPGQSFTLVENSADDTVVGTVSATDPDTGTAFQNWAITGGNTTGAFAIDPDTGIITVADSTQLDLETAPSFTLLVTASDGTNTSAAQSVTIDLSNVNEPPVATADQSFTLAEKTANGSLVGAVVATDPDAGTAFQNWTITGGTGTTAFAIDPNTGALTVADSTQLNVEPAPSFTLLVTVSDGVNTSAVQTVTVNLTDVNEQPVLGGVPNSAGVPELVPYSFTATATDPDNSDTLTFSLIGAPSGAAIDPNTGAFTWTPAEEQGPGSYSFTVRVTDGAGLFDERTTTLGVTEGTPPVLAPINSVTVRAGQSVSFTATATDADRPADGLTFSLRSAPPGASIDPVTGAFAFTPPRPGTFSFEVVVTDNGSPALSASQAVTITAQNTDLIAVGAGAGNRSQVRAFDATTGALKFDFRAYSAGFGGARGAVGDVTGDGIADIVTVPAAGMPLVKVFDGSNGSEVASFLAYPAPIPAALAVGDLNNDGFADVVVGTNATLGAVLVYDGRTFALRGAFLPFGLAPVGVNVAVGDTDGDGQKGIIASTATGLAVVGVFDGQTFAQKQMFLPFGLFAGGATVAAGDLDGAGADELVIGTAHSVSAVGVFKGSTQTALFFPFDMPVGVNVAVKDVDGDGRDDILTSTLLTAQVRAFSGTDLTLLDSFFAFGPPTIGGGSIG